VRAVSVVVALDASVDAGAVEAALTSDEQVQILGFVHGLEDEANPLQDTPSDVLVVACDQPSEDAVAFIRSACDRRPGRPVVVLTSGAENGNVASIFEAGADDIVRLGQEDWWASQELSEQLSFVLEKAVARRAGTPASTTDSGRLICILGPKGGIGKTLTASNLSASLAETGASVTVVDVDLQFGDVGLALGLRPDRTLYDLARSAGSLDADKLDAYLATHDSGVRALLAPTRPDQAGAVTPELLATVYPVLRSMSDYVIVDTPPGFTPEVITSIDSSSDICLVGMLDSLSLKNTKLGLETLELMGYAEERTRLVLNRADSRVGITPADVAEIVGRTPDILVPSARDVTRSVNEGIPIVQAQPRSEAARAFRSLAALYTQSQNGRTRTRSKGRRRRLGIGRR
jgi:pilus assembly protein CpaE